MLSFCARESSCLVGISTSETIGKKVTFFTGASNSREFSRDLSSSLRQTVLAVLPVGEGGTAIPTRLNKLRGLFAEAREGRSHFAGSMQIAAGLLGAATAAAAAATDGLQGVLLHASALLCCAVSMPVLK
jgi:hypothetical protein